MSMRRKAGLSIIELLVSIGIMGVVLGIAGSSLNLLNSVDSHLVTADDIATFRFLALRQMACHETVFPAAGGGALAPSCSASIGQPLGTSCEGLPGLTVYRRAMDGSYKVLIPEQGKQVADYQLRTCCPGGQPRIETRRLNKAGTAEKTDTLTGKKWTWNSLFGTDSICGAVAPPGSTVTRIVTGNLSLATPSAVCPGIFRNVGSLSQPEAVLNFYDGTAQCPGGWRLIGGGANCNGLGFLPTYALRSAVADAHPRLADSSTSTLSDSNTFYASCCGSLLNPASKNNRVYAICERD